MQNDNRGSVQAGATEPMVTQPGHEAPPLPDLFKLACYAETSLVATSSSVRWAGIMLPNSLSHSLTSFRVTPSKANLGEVFWLSALVDTCKKYHELSLSLLTLGSPVPFFVKQLHNDRSFLAWSL